MGLLVALVLTMATPSPTVSAAQRFYHAPAYVRLLARTHATDENPARAWCLTVWAEDSEFTRRSCERADQLALSRVVTYDGVPGGHYVAEFAVEYQTGHRAATTTFCVTGMTVTCGGEER